MTAALILALLAAIALAAVEHRLRVRADRRRRNAADYATLLRAERAQLRADLSELRAGVNDILAQLDRVEITPAHGAHLPVRVPGEALQRGRGAAA